MEFGGGEEALFWQSLQMVSQRFLERNAQGVVVKVYTPVSESIEVLNLSGGGVLSHAGPGTARVWFSEVSVAKEFVSRVLARNWEPFVEAASQEARGLITLWPKPGGDFAIMERIKRMFDPQGLLNSGRLYDRI